MQKKRKTKEGQVSNWMYFSNVFFFDGIRTKVQKRFLVPLEKPPNTGAKPSLTRWKRLNVSVRKIIYFCFARQLDDWSVFNRSQFKQCLHLIELRPIR